MTRALLNNAIWAVSLALQCVLLGTILWRGVARRLPVFTLLLGFYLARAAVLFALFGHVDRDAYAAIYSGLALMDLVLQFAVAVELAVQLLRGWGGLGRVQARVVAAIPLLAMGATAATLRVIPVYTRLPPDRIQMFDSFVMMMLCVCAFAWRSARLLRWLLAGFAAYGVVNVASIAGRSVAAAHRDARAFTAWPYAVVGTYAAVLVWWLVMLRGDGPGAAAIENDAAEPAGAEAI